jgi:hypothetical protein
MFLQRKLTFSISELHVMGHWHLLQSKQCQVHLPHVVHVLSVSQDSTFTWFNIETPRNIPSHHDITHFRLLNVSAYEQSPAHHSTQNIHLDSAPWHTDISSAVQAHPEDWLNCHCSCSCNCLFVMTPLTFFALDTSPTGAITVVGTVWSAVGQRAVPHLPSCAKLWYFYQTPVPEGWIP